MTPTPMKQQSLRVALINMPFAKMTTPSLALAQLDLVLKAEFGNRVHVDTCYVNMDFALHVGDFSVYDHPYASYGLTGACDWFFRQAAFPEVPDNSEEFLSRHYPGKDPSTRKIKKFLLEERKGLDRILNNYIDKYHLLDADIVGFTLFFAETCASFAMARLLKERKPGIITIIGGAMCEGETAEVYAESVPQIDYVFSGPGLVSLPKFVGHILAGKKEKCDHINGVLSKTNKAFWYTPKTCDSSSIAARAKEEAPACQKKGMISTAGDELDININLIPDYTAFLDEFEGKFPGGKIKPILIFETSRGCRWGEHRQCLFCGMNGKTLRYRTLTPENAIIQVESLYKYVPRANAFLATDNMFPENYTREVLPLLKPPPAEIQIKYQARSTFTASDIEILCKTGFSRIQPGIESLSTSTLKLIHKGTTAFQNIRFLKDSSLHPLTLDWNLLTFIPGEKEDIYERYMYYIPLLSHLPPPKSVFPIMFVKFSHYFEHAKKYKLDLKPRDYYSMIFPLNTDDIRRMAYYFIDSNTDAKHMHEWLERMNKAVAKWRTRWLNEDGKAQSRLCFLRDSSQPVIYDSRSGDVDEYPVAALTRDIINKLEQPAGKDELVKQFGKVPGFDVDREIGFLVKRGLLFEEDSRFMSLVAG